MCLHCCFFFYRRNIIALCPRYREERHERKYKRERNCFLCGNEEYFYLFDKQNYFFFKLVPLGKHNPQLASLIYITTADLKVSELVSPALVTPKFM